MVSNELVQAAIISKLKANTTLTDFLGGATAIKELQFQGANFAYPAVRASIGTQQPLGVEESCYETTGEITFSVISFSENDSSRQCDELAGLVYSALKGSQLSGTGFRTLRTQVDSITKSVRIGLRLWQSVGLYRARIYETN